MGSISLLFDDVAEFFEFVKDLLSTLGSFSVVLVTLLGVSMSIGIGSWLLHRL